jgi:hypothetical protein
MKWHGSPDAPNNGSSSSPEPQAQQQQQQQFGHGVPYGAQASWLWKAGDTIGCLLDTAAGAMRFTHNGRDLGMAFTRRQQRAGRYRLVGSEPIHCYAMPRTEPGDRLPMRLPPGMVVHATQTEEDTSGGWLRTRQGWIQQHKQQQQQPQVKRLHHRRAPPPDGWHAGGGGLRCLLLRRFAPDAWMPREAAALPPPGMIITDHGLERRGVGADAEEDDEDGNEDAREGRAVLAPGLEVDAAEVDVVTVLLTINSHRRGRRRRERRGGDGMGVEEEDDDPDACAGLLLDGCEVLVFPKALPPFLEVRQGARLLAEAVLPLSAARGARYHLSVRVHKADGCVDIRLLCEGMGQGETVTVSVCLPSFLQANQLGPVGVVLRPTEPLLGFSSSNDEEEEEEEEAEGGRRRPSLAICSLVVLASGVEGPLDDAVLHALEPDMRALEAARATEPVWHGSGGNVSGSDGDEEVEDDVACAWEGLMPAMSCSEDEGLAFNLGHSPFRYPPPDGYQPLAAAALEAAATATATATGSSKTAPPTLALQVFDPVRGVWETVHSPCRGHRLLWVAPCGDGSEEATAVGGVEEGCLMGRFLLEEGRGYAAANAVATYPIGGALALSSSTPLPFPAATLHGTLWDADARSPAAEGGPLWGWRLTVTPSYPVSNPPPSLRTALVAAAAHVEGMAIEPVPAGGALDAQLIRYVNAAARKRGLGPAALLSADWAALAPEPGELVAWPLLAQAIMAGGGGAQQQQQQRRRARGWEESKVLRERSSAAATASSAWLVINPTLIIDAGSEGSSGASERVVLVLSEPQRTAKPMAALPLGFSLPVMEEKGEDEERGKPGRHWLRVDLGGQCAFIRAPPPSTTATPITVSHHDFSSGADVLASMSLLPAARSVADLNQALATRARVVEDDDLDGSAVSEAARRREWAVMGGAGGQGPRLLPADPSRGLPLCLALGGEEESSSAGPCALAVSVLGYPQHDEKGEEEEEEEEEEEGAPLSVSGVWTVGAAPTDLLGVVLRTTGHCWGSGPLALGLADGLACCLRPVDGSLHLLAPPFVPGREQYPLGLWPEDCVAYLGGGGGLEPGTRVAFQVTDDGERVTFTATVLLPPTAAAAGGEEEERGEAPATCPWRSARLAVRCPAALHGSGAGRIAFVRLAEEASEEGQGWVRIVCEDPRGATLRDGVSIDAGELVGRLPRGAVARYTARTLYESPLGMEDACDPVTRFRLEGTPTRPGGWVSERGRYRRNPYPIAERLVFPSSLLAGAGAEAMAAPTLAHLRIGRLVQQQQQQQEGTWAWNEGHGHCYKPQRLAPRFRMLRGLNTAVLAALPYINLTEVASEATTTSSSSSSSSSSRCRSSIAALVADSRHLLFSELKMGLWDAALEATATPLDSPLGPSRELQLSRPLAARHRASGTTDAEARVSLWGQAFQQLRGLPGAAFRLRAGQALYHTVLRGEMAQDAGGPYRETLATFAEELQSSALPLLLRCPNAVHNVGANRDKWVPHPGATGPLALEQFAFLGRLMGLAARTQQYLELGFPSLVWKQLVGQRLTREDLEGVDALLVRGMDSLRTIEAQVCVGS